jgi:hypothetical protein
MGTPIAYMTNSRNDLSIWSVSMMIFILKLNQFFYFRSPNCSGRRFPTKLHLILMRRDPITIFLVLMVPIYLFMYKFKNVNR